MRPISIEGFHKPERLDAGAVPMLSWVAISEMVVDPAYQRPITRQGHCQVDQIARNFSWSCFAPVIVSPVEGGKFAIIDGQHRTTAAALVGIDTVPCQVVILPVKEQAAAFKAINGITTPMSRMALHTAAVTAGDPLAIQVEEVASCAGVELLRYPVMAGKLVAGQTLAIGAIYWCLERYGRNVLITALQCITQTNNNKPGALCARSIRATCDTLSKNVEWQDAGLNLLEAFDRIDIAAINNNSALEAVVGQLSREHIIGQRISFELTKMLPKIGRHRSAAA